MEKNERITLILLVIFTIFDLLLLRQKITLRTRAVGETLQLFVKVQGNYQNGSSVASRVKIYSSSSLVKEIGEVTLTAASSSGIFSTQLDVTGLSPGEKHTVLVKPDKGIGKAFCGNGKSSGNCFQSDLLLLKNTDVHLDFDPVLLGDMPPQNGKVDAYDISRIKGGLGKTDSASDVNSNGIVDSEDYSLALYSLGKNAKDDEATWVIRDNPTPTASVSATPAATPTSRVSLTPTSIPTPTGGPTPTVTGTPSGKTYNKKVSVIIYNPILTSQSNQKLVQFKQWNDPVTLVDQAIDWFKTKTKNRVNYQVVSTVERNQWIKKEDGFTYDEATYLSCLSDVNNCHQPDIADYRLLLDQDNVCNRFNQGEFDEVWLLGGPWFGFYESRLTGTNAFPYNSPPLTNTACTGLLPIMGYSYERDVAEIIHDFGHRTESTMTQVYGSWHKDSLDHNWDKFALVKSQSTSFTFSGCGSIHYAPNSGVEYSYNQTATVNSFCDDFFNYPNLKSPSDALKPVTSTAWNSSDIGYYEYWFAHLPRFSGTGPDGKLNDWWDYLLDPELALGF